MKNPILVKCGTCSGLRRLSSGITCLACNGIGEVYSYHCICPICGKCVVSYGGGWRCGDPHCTLSSNGLQPNNGPEPEWWSDPDLKVMRYNNQWIAFDSNSRGIGVTPHEAVHNRFKDPSTLLMNYVETNIFTCKDLFTMMIKNENIDNDFNINNRFDRFRYVGISKKETSVLFDFMTDVETYSLQLSRINIISGSSIFKPLCKEILFLYYDFYNNIEPSFRMLFNKISNNINYYGFVNTKITPK